MWKFSAPLFLLCVAACGAQSGDDGPVLAAKAELARVQGLVAAGALPRASLEKAQDAVADAEDSAILRRTAYGSELNVDQADEMVAAANRRLDRREKARDAAAQLVGVGAAPKASLQPLDDEVEAERREVGVVESRAKLIHEISEMASAEDNYLSKLAHSPAEAAELAAGYSADGAFVYATYAKVEVAFRERFGKPMPVSAMGETAVHRAMGFDHRGRVDIAINPDQPEGEWLIDYLKQNHIPYFAFRGPVKGKATGAHIHIGPMSTHLASGG
ncbi:MAG: hypothetical protein WDO73_31845 [Ignavibacteriota bacterium]